MPTAKDVAKAANVSATTVSYVMNGNHPISTEVRERVMQAAAALGYDPKPSQRIKQPQTNTITLVLQLGWDTELDSLIPFLEPAYQHAQQKGFTPVLLHNFSWSRSMLDDMKRIKTDGFLLFDIKRQDPNLQEITQLGVPSVLIGRSDAPIAIDAVDTDHRAAAELLARELGEAGAEHIYLLDDAAHPEHRNESNVQEHFWFKDEFHFYTSYVANMLRISSEYLQLPIDDWNGIQHLLKTIRTSDKRCGIAARNPTQLSMVETAAHFMGLVPGKDFLLAGICAEHIARKQAVPPTNVDPHADVVMRTAIDQLIQLIKGDVPTGNITLIPPTLTRRATTIPS